jgi:hypothetical protein
MGYKDKEKQRAASRKSYLKRGKAYWLAKQTAKRKAAKEWVDSLKTKCTKCGYNRCVEALEFHHKDGDDKLRGISKMMRNNWSKKKILAEIEKCVVLCANCHREEGTK